MAVLDDIAREKQRLPRGWGRFGKTLETLAEICEPDESVLASCVGLNPNFQHKAITLEFTLLELQKSTNVILVATDQRLLILATGVAGGARDHHVLSYEGLELLDVQKKELTLGFGENRMRIHGMAKQMLPGLVEALTRRGIPAPS